MKKLLFGFALGAASFVTACAGLVGFDDSRHLAPDETPDAAKDATELDGSIWTPVDAPPPDGTRDAHPDVLPDATPDPSCVDFYVPGSGHCHFPTITSAITAARASSALARTIHVAAGTYDTTSGETFPLDLRGGISLEGTSVTNGDAATVETIVVGIGDLKHDVEGGEMSTTMPVTIVTGDQSVASHVKNVRILPSENTTTMSGYGIYCDRGNTVAGAKLQPSPNLVVDGVIFEHGYERAIDVSNSTYPKTGCNAKIVGSSFHAIWEQFTAYGVAVGVCDPTSDSAETALELGDGTAAGKNILNSMGRGDHTGAAVDIRACASTVIIHGNEFHTGEAGVYANTSLPDTHITIIGNTFFQMADAGVRGVGQAIFEEISNNIFIKCDIAGISLGSGHAQVLKARNNIFSGNRNGFAVENDSITGTIDFGTQGSPGGNEFRCNASTTTAFGCDFAVFPNAATGAVLTAYGNKWDHAPPTWADYSTVVNGQDVLAPAANLVDTGGATVSTYDCSLGLPAGP